MNPFLADVLKVLQLKRLHQDVFEGESRDPAGLRRVFGGQVLGQALAAAYAEVAPWFEECCCPIHPAGLTLARQLFWQSRAFPDDFRRARWILPFAQYWAWGLCGVPASEAQRQQGGQAPSRGGFTVIDGGRSGKTRRQRHQGGASFMDRMEERWRRRREDNGF